MRGWSNSLTGGGLGLRSVPSGDGSSFSRASDVPCVIRCRCRLVAIAARRYAAATRVEAERLAVAGQGQAVAAPSAAASASSLGDSTGGRSEGRRLP